MAAADEIERIHERLNGVEATLKEMQKTLVDLSIQQAKHACPNPGMCVYLKDSLSLTNYNVNENVKIRESINRRVASLERWQAGVIATTVVVMALLTILGPSIRKTLGIP
jgi:hypothetical protein